MIRLRPILAILAAAPLFAQQAAYNPDRAQQFLKTYCQTCHQGASPAGNFNVQKLSGIDSDLERWNRLALRIRNGEMPPKGAPAPPVDQREQFTQWIASTLQSAACSDAVAPAPSVIRRLNR